MGEIRGRPTDYATCRSEWMPAASETALLPGMQCTPAGEDGWRARSKYIGLAVVGVLLGLTVLQGVPSAGAQVSFVIGGRLCIPSLPCSLPGDTVRSTDSVPGDTFCAGNSYGLVELGFDLLQFSTEGADGVEVKLRG